MNSKHKEHYGAKILILIPHQHKMRLFFDTLLFIEEENEKINISARISLLPHLEEQDVKANSIPSKIILKKQKIGYWEISKRTNKK
jgi:hypothetical protein